MGIPILVIEDDPSIRRGLEMNLQAEGFAVRAASSGRAGLALQQEERAALVVLDVVLPDMSGFDVVRQLRAWEDDTPILMLSARRDQVDKVRGLELGADDYLTKPFGFPELVARIRAHLRRRGVGRPVTFGDVQVDIDRRLVRRSGEEVPMTAREFDLLCFLVEREGRPATRQAVLDAVWGHDYVGTDRTVDNFITRLRAKLDDPDTPRHFQTVRGIGYRFVADPDA